MSRRQPLGGITLLFTGLFIWPQRRHPATAALPSTELAFHCQLELFGLVAVPLICPLADHNRDSVAVGPRVVWWDTSVKMLLRGP